MADAFAPVGLMIDEWRSQLPAGKELAVPVVVINDLYQDWKGQGPLPHPAKRKAARGTNPPLRGGGAGADEVELLVHRSRVRPGTIRLEASLLKGRAKPVRSLRDFKVGVAPERLRRRGIAHDKPVKASSIYLGEAMITDPRMPWTDFPTPAGHPNSAIRNGWRLILALPRRSPASMLEWETACGQSYAIQVSLDGSTWTDVYTTTKGKGDTEDIKFAPTSARWVRLHGTRRARRGLAIRCGK